MTRRPERSVPISIISLLYKFQYCCKERTSVLPQIDYHALFKTIGSLPLSEWRQRRSEWEEVDEKGGMQREEEGEGKLQPVYKINGKMLFKLNKKRKAPVVPDPEVRARNEKTPIKHPAYNLSLIHI